MTPLAWKKAILQIAPAMPETPGALGKEAVSLRGSTPACRWQVGLASSAGIKPLPTGKGGYRCVYFKGC